CVMHGGLGSTPPYSPKNFTGHGVLTEHLAVRCHELSKPLFPHVGNGRVPVASLVIERQGSMLHGIGLQEAIEAGPFSCLPKERLHSGVKEPLDATRAEPYALELPASPHRMRPLLRARRRQ